MLKVKGNQNKKSFQNTKYIYLFIVAEANRDIMHKDA